MMDALIVVLIVAAAAIYVGWIFYNGFKQKGDCACGCTCCSISDSCNPSAAGSTRDGADVQEDP